MYKVIVIAMSALLLAACASAPQRSESIEQARAAIQTLQADPLTQQVAASDLQSAQARLQDAQTALSQKDSPEAVDHLAYLARRHAEAGLARVEAARAQAEVAHSQEERARIMLAARAAEADQAKAQAASANAQLAQTQQELADLKAKQTDRGLVVTLADVLFDSGQATLKPGADLTLDHLTHYLQDNPHTRILIEGFTDSVGTDAYNDALSQRRADAVASALIRRGAPEDAVHAIGRGKSYPVATNDTSAGRQQNRRVEIVFSDASGRFAQASEDETLRR
jgi:outer membrane protein OmpA-like peptidoglycan-associated protein